MIITIYFNSLKEKSQLAIEVASSFLQFYLLPDFHVMKISRPNIENFETLTPARAPKISKRKLVGRR